jgi:uncharacterized spore protein YtfJ
MENDNTEAMNEARRAAATETRTDRLLEQLVERIGGRTGVQTLFGEPIERNGTTVVPVARVRWGIGAGAGSMSGVDEGTDATGSGSGGGGGAVADPVGYIELDAAGVRFRPIVGLPPNPLAILAFGLALTLVLRAVARLLGR